MINIQWPTYGSQLSIYEPNQFVLSRGVLDFTGGPLRIRTPLSRNLNSGDRIQLSHNLRDTTIRFSYCKIAITLNNTFFLYYFKSARLARQKRKE